MEDVEEHVEALFYCMKRVRRKYAKCITEVALHASWRLAHACNEGELVDEDLPRGQERKRPKSSSILEVHEARNDCMESIMWRSTDILSSVVGEVEGRGAIKFTYVCDYEEKDLLLSG